MIDKYYYSGQIRRYLLQCCAIFTGLMIKTGKGEAGVEEYIRVPVHIGNKDRVVAAITAGNTKNRSYPLPIMSVDMSSIELAPERRKGIGGVDRRVTIPTDGVFPDDLKVVYRLMPVPYDLTIDLSIYVSNTLQVHQVLEQILVLFDPIIQIQTTDANFDWTKITTVELLSIQNEQNYPSGTDKRIQIWSMTFKLPIWLSAPMDVRNEIVHDIFIKLGDLDKMNIMEFDDEGNLNLFADPLALYGIAHTSGSADDYTTVKPSDEE